MAVSVLFTATPAADAGDAMQEHTSQEGSVMAASGGELIKRARIAKPLIFSPDYTMSVLMQFPSPEAIEKVLEGDEDKALILARDKAFWSLQASIIAHRPTCSIGHDGPEACVTWPAVF